MWIYYNQFGNLTTKIPHGEVIRQGATFNFYIAIDKLYFKESIEESTNRDFLSFTLNEIKDWINNYVIATFKIKDTTIETSIIAEVMQFRKLKTSEMVFDLIDKGNYIVFHFTGEHSLLTNFGNYEAVFKLEDKYSDSTKTMGLINFYVEKTYGGSTNNGGGTGSNIDYGYLEENYYNKSYIDRLSETYVNTTGNQTIGGRKTFSSDLEIKAGVFYDAGYGTHFFSKDYYLFGLYGDTHSTSICAEIRDSNSNYSFKKILDEEGYLYSNNTKINVDEYLLKSGGEVSGPIVLNGGASGESLQNTAQIVMKNKTTGVEQWSLSSNDNMFVVNPSRVSTEGQLVVEFNKTVYMYESDLGDVSHKWKDLYLSGSLSDGTSSISVAKIANIDDIPTPAKGGYNGYIYVGGDGVAEMGKYIDFHSTSTDTKDYDVRVVCPTLETGISIALPSSGGTFALKEDLANYLPISGGEITGSITPKENNSINLGSENNHFSNVYANKHIGSLYADDILAIVEYTTTTGTTIGSDLKPTIIKCSGNIVKQGKDGKQITVLDASNIGSYSLSLEGTNNLRGSLIPGGGFSSLTLGDTNHPFAYVHSQYFVGSLTGNAASATAATKATNDSDNNPINTTYLKKSGGSLSGDLTSQAIKPGESNKFDIGAQQLVYNNVYATNFKGTADKATADASGNPISTTYWKKEDLTLSFANGVLTITTK